MSRVSPAPGFPPPITAQQKACSPVAFLHNVIKARCIYACAFCLLFTSSSLALAPSASALYRIVVSRHASIGWVSPVMARNVATAAAAVAAVAPLLFGCTTLYL